MCRQYANRPFERVVFKSFFHEVLIHGGLWNEMCIRESFENVVAQELLANGFNLYYFNNKKQGELDFVIELDGKVTPLEIKSGKDYKKHSALVNVLKDKNYEIEKAYIFSEGNVETKGQKIYMPIYMIMFLKNTELKNTIYKIDLSGL